MKFVKLLSSARVNGTLRHPAEGVLHLEDDEADRLIENKEGEDVTSDFTAKQDKQTPVANLDAASDETVIDEDHPHQAEVAPEATEDDTAKKPARKSAAHKE